MRTILFLVFLSGVALAGNNCIQNNRVVLEGGRQNKFYFTPGALTGSGEPTLAGSNYQNYGYSFTGLPSWLVAEGNRISGTPPNNGDSGPWPVTVRYTGSRAGDLSGSSNFLLSLSDVVSSASLSGLNTVSYYQGASLNGNQLVNDQAGCYVLLIPVVTSSTISAPLISTGSATSTSSVVSCTSLESSYNSAKQSVSAIQNEAAGYSAQLTTAQAAVESLRSKRDALQSQSSADNGAGIEGKISAANSQASSIAQQLELAKSDAARATQNIASAQANFQTAQSNLQTVSKRRNQIAGNRANANSQLTVAKQRYNQYIVTLTSAKNNFAGAQSDFDNISSKIRGVKNTLAAANDRVAQARA